MPSLEPSLYAGSFQAPLSPAFSDTNGYNGWGQTGGLTPLPTFHHLGDDYAVSSGTAVHSIANGIVVALEGSITPENDTGEGFGNYLVIKHVLPNGQAVFSLYAHLKTVTVSMGEQLVIGEQIGLSGNTGNTQGAHLHFELSHQNAFIDGLPEEPTQLSGGYDSGPQWQGESPSGETSAEITIDPDAFIISSYASAQIQIASPASPQDEPVRNLQWFGAGEDILGGAGADVIYQGFGDDFVDGGDGTDIVHYSHDASDYIVSRIGNTVFVLGPEGSDQLFAVEQLQFADFPLQTSAIPVNSSIADGIGSYDPSQGNVEVEPDDGNFLFELFNFGLNAASGAGTWIGNIIQSIGAAVQTTNSSGEDAIAITTTSGVATIPLADTIYVNGVGSLVAAQLASALAPDDHGDTVGSATVLSSNFLRGNIEEAGDRDVFAVNLVAGQQVLISLQAASTNTFGALDPYLRLLNGSGSSLVESDDLVLGTTSSFISFTPSSSGTYYLQASGYLTTNGEYLLYVTGVDPGSAADSLSETNNPDSDNGSQSIWHWQGDADDNNPSELTLEEGGRPQTSGDNYYRGHDGDDRIYADDGDDVVWGDDGEDRLYGEDGDDVLRGGEDDDRLYGGDDDDLIYGEDGDDRIYGDGTSSSSDNGDDTIYGGDGDDIIDGGPDDDYIKGENDNDDIDGNEGDDELYGDRGDDRIDGDEGNDLIFGGPGADHLEGDEGDDFVAGEDGDDRVEGNDGNDRLYGGDDNDLLIGGAGDDIIHGEGGIDTADFSDGNDGVTVNLFDEVATSTDLGRDLLYSIENIIGSDGDDAIDGDHGRNVLAGEDGDDIIRGHNDDDEISGGDDDDIVWGDEGNDIVSGDSGDDEVRGGLGDDQLFGGSGDDHLRGEQGDDSIDGGAGYDSVFFWGEREDFGISSDGNGTIIVTDLRAEGLEGTDSLVGIEELQFFNGSILVADLFAPDPVAGGDEALSFQGRPILIDALTNDSAGASSASIVAVEVVNGPGQAYLIAGRVAYDPGEGFQSLTSRQSHEILLQYTLQSSSLIQVEGTIQISISGNSEGNVRDATVDNTYYVDDQNDLIFELPGEGIDTVTSTASFYLYANVENLTLAEHDAGGLGQFGVGNELANIIVGNGFSNLLIGGAGDDELHGMSNADSLFGEGGDDTLYGGPGIDYIVGGDGNDHLLGELSADALYGGDGDDILDAGGNFHTDILVGGAGNDILLGNSGLADYDLMDGGDGDDIYYVDTGDDLTFEAVDGGTDTVYANVSGENNGVYLYANVENLVVEGETAFGVGNELDNQLTGGTRGNWLLGGAGADTINGGAGNDVLFGEAGADTFVFNHGTGGDVIGDFTSGEDQIDIQDFGISSFEQLQAAFIQNSNVGAINLGNGDFIVLHNVQMDQLTATDFIL